MFHHHHNDALRKILISFEEENVQAFKLLLRIEVATRECIRYGMEKSYGPSWRRHIPGEVLKKIRDSELTENRPNFNYVRLGPLYYLTLGELIPILRQKISSNVVEIFGGDWFISEFESILGLRNALCHARPVPSPGLKVLDSLYQRMKTALESNSLIEIVSNPDVGMFPEDAAELMAPWIENLNNLVSTLRSPIAVHEAYEAATRQYWWGMPELAGFDCSAVDRVVRFLNDYNSLATGVGSAAVRQRFCDDKKPAHMIDTAFRELKRISS